MRVSMTASLTSSMNICGHSFCKTCITNNKESGIGPGGESSCPVCGIRYSPGNLWLNQHLANIVEKLKEVKISPEEGQKRDVCERHGEKLQLFCKEDRKVICPLCECSREHCGHQILLMEKVVKECQVRPLMEGGGEEIVLGGEVFPSCFTHHSMMYNTEPCNLLPCMSLNLCSPSPA